MLEEFNSFVVPIVDPVWADSWSERVVCGWCGPDVAVDVLSEDKLGVGAESVEYGLCDAIELVVFA